MEEEDSRHTEGKTQGSTRNGRFAYQYHFFLFAWASKSSALTFAFAALAPGEIPMESPLRGFCGGGV